MSPEDAPDEVATAPTDAADDSSATSAGAEDAPTASEHAATDTAEAPEIEAADSETAEDDSAADEATEDAPAALESDDTAAAETSDEATPVIDVSAETLPAPEDADAPVAVAPRALDLPDHDPRHGLWDRDPSRTRDRAQARLIKVSEEDMAHPSMAALAAVEGAASELAPADVTDTPDTAEASAAGFDIDEMDRLRTALADADPILPDADAEADADLAAADADLADTDAGIETPAALSAEEEAELARELAALEDEGALDLPDPLSDTTAAAAEPETDTDTATDEDDTDDLMAAVLADLAGTPAPAKDAAPQPEATDGATAPDLSSEPTASDDSAEPVAEPDFETALAAELDAEEDRAEPAPDAVADPEPDPDTAADPAPQPAAPSAEAERHAARRNSLIEDKPADDERVARLIEETNTKLQGAENRRRRSAIAHLKAAVAAARAEGRDRRRKDDPKEAEPYREDLAKVVRPRQAPQADPARRRGPQPPLVLVSQQRIDDARAARPSQKVRVVVRPRRVTPGDISYARPDAETAAPSPAADTSRVASETFGQFAERMGAAGFKDLLECAAAYVSYVEGAPHFTHPQLMKQVTDLTEQEDLKREESLRLFGQLLRQGRIRKVEAGKFTIAKDSQYRPEQRRA
ncbi:hypothetical protein FHS66_000693 [Pacificitalea manganoxidans]|nr:hypothetical protein [Pacificitalea manganoxidans]